MDLDRLGHAWVRIDGANPRDFFIGADDGRPRLAEGTTMYIDYVRIYQKEGEESITCDPRNSLRLHS